MSLMRYPQLDFSGGIQRATSFLLKKSNEIANLRNGRFNIEIGAIFRRNGHTRVGDSFANSSQSTPTGGFVAKFSTGNVRFVAVNASNGLTTVIKSQNSGTGAWTDRVTGLPANAVINWTMWLDELYITGYDPSTGYPITPQNIDSSLNVSTTRNILNMPACRYLTEFNGALYASNVRISSVNYPDRSYKSSGPLGFITTVRGEQGATSASGDITIYADSVRYIKAGMDLDMYTAGTETKTQDLTVVAVDKNANSFTVATPQTSTVSSIDTATELFTISSTTNYPTGTPVQITASTTMPAPLVAGTTYWIINNNSTTFKLATTYANAIAGTAINITSAGSGTITVRRGYRFTDNDEIWLDGRKGKTTIFWNTDYPTTESSDWTATRPGLESSNAITGVGKSSGRLFFFTKNSSQKFDGQNTTPFNHAVGCISHNTIRNIDDDWMVWVDSKGRVWVRNDSTGQQEYISRSINRVLMRYISLANLSAASANVYDNQYYLYLGQVNVGSGNEYIRAVYSFDDNVWAIDRLPRPAMFADNDDYTGETKPYFFSTDGYLYIDDSGNLDHDSIIPLEIDLGRDNWGTERIRKFDGMFIYSENMAGADVKLSVNGGDPKSVASIQQDEEYIKFSESGDLAPPRGTSASASITIANKGDAPGLYGVIWYGSAEEDVPSARRTNQV